MAHWFGAQGQLKRVKNSKPREKPTSKSKNFF